MGFKACNIQLISIHALHEECDPETQIYILKGVISIHALHEECDFTVFKDIISNIYISIHALHEECDLRLSSLNVAVTSISIHALHEECDGYGYFLGQNQGDFNPRTP